MSSQFRLTIFVHYYIANSLICANDYIAAVNQSTHTSWTVNPTPNFDHAPPIPPPPPCMTSAHSAQYFSRGGPFSSVHVCKWQCVVINLPLVILICSGWLRRHRKRSSEVPSSLVLLLYSVYILFLSSVFEDDIFNCRFAPASLSSPPHIITSGLSTTSTRYQRTLNVQ